MPHFIDDNDRYDRLRLIAWWDQERLAASRVMVVGAGAIGNEVLKNLALLGVGHLMVIDCDAIEESNLTRSVLFRSRDRGRSKAEVAAEAVRDLNPDVVVRAIHGNILSDLGLGAFQAADVVIGCLDNREARLWVNRQCWKVGTPWIDAGIQEINGVVKVFVPPHGACYECGMTENDYRLINLRYSCPLLSRDEILAGKTPTAPTIASIIGGMQVQEAVKVLHGLPVAEGQAHVYNGHANRLYSTAYQRRQECLSHEVYESVIEAPLSAQQHTARDLFQWWSSRDESGRDESPERASPQLVLDRDLVLAIECACGWSRRVMQAATRLTQRDAVCPNCQSPAQPRRTDCIDANGPWADEKLASLGIPRFDIVRLRSSHGEQHVLLGADRAAEEW